MKRKIYHQINGGKILEHYSYIEDWLEILKDQISVIDIKRQDSKTNKPFKIKDDEREFLEKNIEDFINESEDFLFIENSDTVKRLNGKARKTRTLQNGNIVSHPPIKIEYFFKLVMKNNNIIYSFNLTDYEKIIKRLINLKKLGI